MNLLVTSGGFGKVTKDVWCKPEGERFAELVIAMGADPNKVLIEDRATNTGDNVKFSRQLLNALGRSVRSGILVTKPYMNRRAYATAAKQWPEVEWSVAPPEISFEAYPNEEVSEERMINLMVGDTQRISVYEGQGFQIHQDIPDSVETSFQKLVKRGYTTFLIK